VDNVVPLDGTGKVPDDLCPATTTTTTTTTTDTSSTTTTQVSTTTTTTTTLPGGGSCGRCGDTCDCGGGDFGFCVNRHPSDCLALGGDACLARGQIDPNGSCTDDADCPSQPQKYFCYGGGCFLLCPINP